MRGWSWISNNISTAYGFGIMQTPNGTSPTAGTQNDTLTYTSSDSSVTITGNSGTKTIDFVVGSLSGTYVPYSGAVTTLNLGTRDLKMPSGNIIDAAGLVALQVNNRDLQDAFGAPVVQWGTYQLFDSTLAESANWSTRQLFNPLGTNVLDWSGTDISVGANLQLGSYNVYANAFQGAGIYNSYGQILFDLNTFASYDPYLAVNINLGYRQLIDTDGYTVVAAWGGYSG